MRQLDGSAAGNLAVLNTLTLVREFACDRLTVRVSQGHFKGEFPVLVARDTIDRFLDGQLTQVAGVDELSRFLKVIQSETSCITGGGRDVIILICFTFKHGIGRADRQAADYNALAVCQPDGPAAGNLAVLNTLSLVCKLAIDLLTFGIGQGHCESEFPVLVARDSVNSFLDGQLTQVAGISEDGIALLFIGNDTLSSFTCYDVTARICLVLLDHIIDAFWQVKDPDPLAVFQVDFPAARNSTVRRAVKAQIVKDSGDLPAILQQVDGESEQGIRISCIACHDLSEGQIPKYLFGCEVPDCQRVLRVMDAAVDGDAAVGPDGDDVKGIVRFEALRRFRFLQN